MVRIQDDFYEMVNETWLAENPVPGDYSRWSNFDEISKVNEERIRTMLDSEDEPLTPEWTNVRTLWTQGQDETALNSSPFSVVLSSQLATITSITSVESLVEVIMGWCPLIATPVELFPYPDLKNSDTMVMAVDRNSAGLGLQDRDMYFDEKVKEKKEAYLKYLETMSAHIASQCEGLVGDTSEVFKLEERLAESCMTKVDRRDPYKLYNPHTVEQLSELCPVFPWAEFFSRYGVSLTTEQYVVVTETAFMKKLDECIRDVPLATWRHYLAIRLLSSLGRFLDKETDEIRFDFYGKIMTGQQEQKPRWKRVNRMIDSLIGEEVGKKFVEKYFPQESKDQVLAMIERMKTVLAKRIQNLPWMEDETKEKALQKLGTFTVKIGFPDKWVDYSTLKLDPASTYCGNILIAREWDFRKDLAKCYKPVDKSEWHMTPQTVNAYYNPTQNEIVFPAGIIQAPMFDKDADIATNFGGIGAVICHEITHGFDDKGALFDHLGNLANWWTDSDKAKFTECSKKLEHHFNEYVVCGMNVKGDLCLGENIADLGGLSISLEALASMLRDEGVEEEEVREKMKMVFYSFAVVFRNNIKDEESKRRIIMDPHSPGKLRVNGIVRQIPQFYDLFEVNESDQMYLDLEKRAEIW
eukprot:sb/3462934/